jgi:type IV secretion system protein VirD4
LYRQKKEKIPATLPSVDDLLSDPDKTAHEVWTDMITYLHENGATIPIVAKAARDQLNGPKKKPAACSPPPYPI